jgi:cytochrome P450
LELEGEDLAAVRRSIQHRLAAAPSADQVQAWVESLRPDQGRPFEVVGDWFRPVVLNLIRSVTGIDLSPVALAVAAEVVHLHFCSVPRMEAEPDAAAVLGLYRSLRRGSCACEPVKPSGCEICAVAIDSVVFGMASTTHTLMAGWVDADPNEAVGLAQRIRSAAPSVAVERYRADGEEHRIIPLHGAGPDAWHLPFGSGIHRCPGEHIAVKAFLAVGDVLKNAGLVLVGVGSPDWGFTPRVRELRSWVVELRNAATGSAGGAA